MDERSLRGSTDPGVQLLELWLCSGAISLTFAKWYFHFCFSSLSKSLCVIFFLLSLKSKPFLYHVSKCRPSKSDFRRTLEFTLEKFGSCTHLLFRLLDFFFADLFTNGCLLHAKDVSTPLSQLFQAALDVQSGSKDLIFRLPVSDASVPLLQPAWVEQANTHVLLHLTGLDLLTSNWRDKVLVLRSNCDLRPRCWEK